MSRPQNRKRKQLRSSAAIGQARGEPITIPLWWVNSIIGIFLLPLAAVWTRAFLSCLSQATWQHKFWASEECWFFLLGVVLWLIAFFGLPRPLWVYVFGHELTHALWVWAMGGKVSKFQVARTGGHIVTDRHNFWIALAPYFFPLYSIAVIALYGVAGLFYDVLPYRQLLYGLIGGTWAFHISFTLWMIPKGQTDLISYGTFFSLVVIYLMNLLVLSVLLIVASPDITWRGFGLTLCEDAASFSTGVVEKVRGRIF
jgi:hypothetical protein